MPSTLRPCGACCSVRVLRVWRYLDLRRPERWCAWLPMASDNADKWLSSASYGMKSCSSWFQIDFNFRFFNCPSLKVIFLSPISNLLTQRDKLIAGPTRPQFQGRPVRYAIGPRLIEHELIDHPHRPQRRHGHWPRRQCPAILAGRQVCRQFAESI